MNSEKEFKDTLKEKLNAKEFQFDEANWLKASGMLDATRQENKKRPFPYFLAAGILLLTSVIGFFVFKPAETKKEIASTATTTQKATLKNSEAVIEETKEIPSEKNITNSSSIQKTESTTPKNEIEKAETVTDKKNVAIKETISEIKTTTSQAKNKKTRSKKESVLKNTIAITPTQDEEINTTNSKTQQSKQDDALVKDNTETQTANTNVKEYATPVEEIRADELMPIASILTVNAYPIKEPLALIELTEKDPEPKSNVKEPVHFVCFEAGANYLFGWKNPGKKDANGINPVVGLNYANVSKPITFSFGIHYTMVRNLSYSSHTVTTTRYNFGEESDVMVFTPTAMHYLVAPIRIGYSINSKNSFGLGYNVGYLLNLNSNVELYAQSAGKKSNSTILKTSGYTQGFKTFDQQLSVFYRRSLNKDLYVNAEFMYGLTDVKDNKFFNSNVFERNTGLKVTLIYNLFKK